MLPPPPSSTLFPYTTLFRSRLRAYLLSRQDSRVRAVFSAWSSCMREAGFSYADPMAANDDPAFATEQPRSEERRVGKECRYGWQQKQYKKKKQNEHDGDWLH